LQNVEFGEGWEAFWTKVLIDYYTQDFGAVIEIIGAGSPDKPLRGQVQGLAHLDRQRCVATGNLEYPIVYYNEVTGSKTNKPTFHRMHHTRVLRFVDLPSPIERAFGNGLCALSRIISVANAQILMNRYINEKLVNAPPAGLVTFGNVSGEDVKRFREQYLADRSEQGSSTYQPLMHMQSKDPSHPIEVEFVPFAQLPDHFNLREYIEVQVNMIALALGEDPQDIWPLTGQSLGTGTQSKVLAAKGRAKAFANLLKRVERALNLWILPESLEFQFKFTDGERDKEEAETAKVWVDTVNATAAMSDMEKRQLLANRIPAFADVLLDEAGNVRLIDDDVQTDETTATDDVTLEPTDGTQPEPAEAEIENAADEASDDVATEAKDYLQTESEFIRNLSDLIQGGLDRDITSRRFDTLMRAQLTRQGRRAYIDGLADGGVELGDDGLDEDDQSTIATWLAEQSGYITNFVSTLYSDTPGVNDVTARAIMWANKSLDPIYQKGLLAADKNGLYTWILGATEEHCGDCARLSGQKHRLKEWHKKGWLPKADKLACKGFECKCQLARARGRAQGRF
jgi:hypothetical protein